MWLELANCGFVGRFCRSGWADGGMKDVRLDSPVSAVPLLADTVPSYRTLSASLAQSCARRPLNVRKGSSADRQNPGAKRYGLCTPDSCTCFAATYSYVTVSLCKTSMVRSLERRHWQSSGPARASSIFVRLLPSPQQSIPIPLEYYREAWVPYLPAALASECLNMVWIQ